jgi:hypothetical protein
MTLRLSLVESRSWKERKISCSLERLQLLERCTSIFWLNATLETTLRSSLRQHATRILDVDEERQCDDDQVRDRFRRWLSERDNTQWLLVFDNYGEPERYDVTNYYPYTSQGGITVTTRSPEISVPNRRVLTGYCNRLLLVEYSNYCNRLHRRLHGNDIRCPELAVRF